jgi:hypothetical protein
MSWQHSLLLALCTGEHDVNEGSERMGVRCAGRGGVLWRNETKTSSTGEAKMSNAIRTLHRHRAPRGLADVNIVSLRLQRTFPCRSTRNQGQMEAGTATNAGGARQSTCSDALDSLLDRGERPPAPGPLLAHTPPTPQMPRAVATRAQPRSARVIVRAEDTH